MPQCSVNFQRLRCEFTRGGREQKALGNTNDNAYTVAFEDLEERCELNGFQSILSRDLSRYL